MLERSGRHYMPTVLTISVDGTVLHGGEGVLAVGELG